MDLLIIFTYFIMGGGLYALIEDEWGKQDSWLVAFFVVTVWPIILFCYFVRRLFNASK